MTSPFRDLPLRPRAIALLKEGHTPEAVHVMLVSEGQSPDEVLAVLTELVALMHQRDELGEDGQNFVGALSLGDEHHVHGLGRVALLEESDRAWSKGEVAKGGGHGSEALARTRKIPDR